MTESTPKSKGVVPHAKLPKDPKTFEMVKEFLIAAIKLVSLKWEF